MDSWVYDVTSHTFRNARTGKVMTAADMVTVRDAFLEARRQAAFQVVQQYIDRLITYQQFAQAFRALTAETHAALAILGAGGSARFAQLPTATRSLYDALRMQAVYADQFLADVLAGTMTPDEMKNRAGMYQESAVTTYEETSADDWSLDLPYFPGDGDTQCMMRCRCSWSIENVFEGDYAVTYATWVTERDGNVCEDCAARGNEWDRVEVRRRGMTADERVGTRPVREPESL